MDKIFGIEEVVQNVKSMHRMQEKRLLKYRIKLYLKPLDTDITGIPYGAGGAGIPVQRYRDVLKSVTAMEDDSKVYLLLAVEAQSEVHYAMPVRNMVLLQRGPLNSGDYLSDVFFIRGMGRSHESA